MEFLLALVVLPFWCWMFYDCTRREYHRTEWCMALILFNVIGAGYYFLVRWLPRHSRTLQYQLNRWIYRDRLRMLEAEARNLGKAPQFLRLGQLYEDMGQRSQALTAYQQALAQAPNNPQALWESARLQIHQKQWSQAAEPLAQLMQLAPDFKYGEASLAYSQVLVQLGCYDQAQTHLTQHLKTWSHPEAYVLLADLCQQHHEMAQARELLEKMILQLQNSPAFHYRKHRHFITEGQKRLRRIIPQSS